MGDFDPNEREEDAIEFDLNRSSFGKYIKDYHVTNNPEVYDEEHIAFLALWLVRCIFCCKYLKVEKRYLTLANQLHEGHDIFLSQLILWSLYKYLGVATEALKNLKPRDNWLLSGPLWMLQLWLNSTFELSLDDDKPNNTSDIIKNRHIEGVRLAQMTPTDKNKSDWEAFSAYFLMFAKRYHFNLMMSPFRKRTHIPEGFSRKFPAIGEQVSDSKKIWEAFVTP